MHEHQSHSLSYLRLRQVCLAAPKLAPIIADIETIFDVAVCFRDPNVGSFGLENALIPIGTNFLEVVVPTREGTAAGRFIARSRGHGGYMAIFQTNNPRERQAHAKAIGVRTAHEIEREAYQSAQLHPRDCRAAFIELAHSTGGDDRMGNWWPAGATWQEFVRTKKTLRIQGIEIESPGREMMAAHWARILQKPLARDSGDPVLIVDDSMIRFVDGGADAFGAIRVEVTHPGDTLERAIACGYRVVGDSFHLGGVYFRVVSP